MTSSCRMELCRYWPGEGCMAGVMPCHADEPGPDQDRPDSWYDNDPEEGYEFRSDEPGTSAIQSGTRTREGTR